MSGEGLYRSYQKAGPSFLAWRMEKLFTKIETDADIALHNDILSDVLRIIEGDGTLFFNGMAELILYPKKVRNIYKKKRFLFRLAEQMLRIGRKKG